MSDEARRRLADERRLIFVNLLNGVPMAQVMESFKRSEAEVLADFGFVAAKLRSYRFERGMPLVPCNTIAQAKQQRIELLETVSRLNLETDPLHRNIKSYNYDPSGGGLSEGEMAMLELKARAAAR